MIRIVNWLITRKCNLKCKLCAIRDHSYPEMTLEDIESWLNALADYRAFHIIYGGEPLMRKDIEDVIKLFKQYVNDNFTIYHNATNADRMLELCAKYNLKHLTTSIDPMSEDQYRNFRAQHGFKMLKDAKQIGVDDVVATITIDKQNYKHLQDTVKMLTNEGIWSNITTFDPPGGKGYDFSVNDSKIVEEMTLYPHHVKDVFNELYEGSRTGKYLIHIPEVLNIITEHLPRNYKCAQPYSSLTIDADGTPRLCLRIKGQIVKYLTPNTIHNREYIHNAFRYDQQMFCTGCVWTCIMMSEYISKQSEECFENSIIHE